MQFANETNLKKRREFEIIRNEIDIYSNETKIPHVAIETNFFRVRHAITQENIKTQI